MVLCLTSCCILKADEIEDTIPDNAQEKKLVERSSDDTKSGKLAELVSVDRYSVIFDENETFPDEPARKAAEHIDTFIRTAVEMLNSLPEEQYEVLG